MKQSFHAGIVYTLLSAIGLALTGLFGKLGQESFSLFALIFWRFFAAFLLCLAFLALIRNLKRLSTSQLKINFLRAFFTFGAQGSFYYYIQDHSLLNGMVLLNTGPLFIPLIEWGILRHKVGKSSWIGVFVSFLGVLCILQPDTTMFTLASFIGLLAGLCQGISQTLFGLSAREGEKPELGVLLLFLFCAGLSLIPYLLFGTTFRPGETLTSWSLALIVLLGLVSVFNQQTRAIAYQHSTPSRLSPFLYLAVPIAGLFDWLIFHQPPNFLSLIGTLLVVSGGLLKIYLRHKIIHSK